MIDHIRAGVGPALLHCDVVRPYSHSAADTQAEYRSAEELADEARRDPIDQMEHAPWSSTVSSRSTRPS